MATRMQQRRGTAAQWISTNSGNGPILNAGEIGFESDTNKFKIGDGTNHWLNLTYFTDAQSILSSVNGLVDGAPGLLNTLNEIAAAINDDPTFFTTVATNLSNHESDTTNVHGIANTDALASKTYADNAVSTHSSDTTEVHGIPDTTALATKTYADNAVSSHNSDTTNVHGIVDTADLATKTYADTAVSTHSSDTTSVHGITDTAALATKTYADTAVSTHSSDTTDVHGIADTSALATKTYADTAASTAASSSLSTHASDTTAIHGIADTSLLVTTTGTQTLTNKTITTPSGLVKSDVGLGNVDNTSDVNKPVSTATQTALNLKAPLASPTFTGTVTLPANTISQSMMADDSVGTNEIVGLAVTTGKIADGAVTSVKIANDTIVNADINTAAAIDWTKLAISSTVSSTEIGYVDGVTSSIQTQLDAKLAKAGGTMTGALTLSGAPTSDLHAATKLYVDNVTAGLNFHEAVHAASVNNLAVIYNNGTSGVGATLTADTNRAFSTLDGESVAVGQRVLIKNQTDAKQNGIYTLTTNGSVSVPWVLTRATDADNNPTGEMKNGDFTFVQAGTVNASVGFINNSATNPIVIGTDNISYTEFNAGKTIVAGTGLTEATPGTISVATGGITSAMLEDGTIVNADINASAAIAQSKISGLTSALSDKAPIASPTFTGTVTIPTGAALGTPASATLTNATGLPVATGIANLGTGVATFLTTPSSANLASMVTDEIGTGNLILSDIATNAQSASYTLALADKGKLVEISNASANTLTVPPSSSINFPVGSQITVLQTGAGQTTITAGVGVTINGTPGLKLRAQWSSVTLIKRLTDTWVVVGDLTA